jgi:DNA gyrase subunit B
MWIIHRRHRKGVDTYAYDDESVTVITEDRLRVRATPKLYLPNLDKEGALHPIEEGVANAIDEITSDFSVGDEVIITFNEKTKIISIQDNGRGFPFNKLFDMCEVLNSSAKMGEGKRAYGSSGGVHGMGLKLINYFSAYMKIRTERDGKYMEVNYVDGIRGVVKHGKSKDHGSYVEWQYDDRFFSDTNITCDEILNMLKIKSYVIKNATMIFQGKTKAGTEVIKEFKNNTLKDFMKQFSLSTPIIEFKDRFGGDELEIMFGFDGEALDDYTFAAYTNNIYNKSGGSHVEGVLGGISNFFSTYMYEEYLPDKEKKDLKITAADCRTGLVGIIATYTQNPSFKGGQHKEKLDMAEIKNFALRATRKALKALDKSKLNKLAAVIRANAKARVSADASKKKAKSDFTNAFSAAKIQDYLAINKKSTVDFAELFVGEGLSAIGAMESAADRDFQAIIAIRGKLDNVFDMTAEEAMKTPFVDNLVKIFGCGIGKTFDMSKFPFDRVNFATDADTDGNEIACQMGMIMFRFFPQVVASGRVYRVVPPLYEIKKAGKSIFIPTIREFMTITQNNFATEHKIFCDGKRLSDGDSLELLVGNELYLARLTNIANEYAITDTLCEFLICNKDIGFTNDKVDIWREKLAPMFRFLQVEAGDKFITIRGMDGTEFNLFDYVPEFLEHIEQIDPDTIFYGYSIDTPESTSMSLHAILKMFEKYMPKIENRFKGLGEMDYIDLKRTMMAREVRHSMRLTVRNSDDVFEKMAIMHSQKPGYRKLRKHFMANFKFDIMNIDT